MDSDNAYEMTQPAAKLMNWCRELAVMTDEQFMLQYNSLSTTAKKQLLTIPAINNHQTTCTFPWSGFTLSSLQERSPPITQAVPSSSGRVLPDLPHPDTNDLDTTIPIENNQQEGDEQQTEFVPNRRRRMDTKELGCPKLVVSGAKLNRGCSGSFAVFLIGRIQAKSDFKRDDEDIH